MKLVFESSSSLVTECALLCHTVSYAYYASHSVRAKMAGE